MPDQPVALFREEVFAARRVRLQGEIMLARPLRAHTIIVLLTSSILTLALWVSTGRYARTETAKGILVTNAESAKIIALRPGIVTSLLVKEGQVVQKGQVLATIQVDQDYSSGGRATQESLNAIEAQQHLANDQIATVRQRGRSEKAGLIAAITSARNQYRDVQDQISIENKLIDSLQETLRRYQPAAEKGFISQTEMDRRQQEVLTARGELGRLHQQLTNLAGEQAKSMAALNQSRADEQTQTANAKSSVEGFRSQTSQLRAQQSYILRASYDGTVTALQSGIGRTVDSNVPLLTIIPKDAVVHAEIYAPSRAIGFVRQGEEVRLLYDAFPYQRFGSFKGHISAVSRVALDPRQIDTPFHIEEPVYRVSVVPDQQRVSGYGEQVRLQPGMTLTANIVLERRSFATWLLEPLSAITKRDK